MEELFLFLLESFAFPGVQPEIICHFILKPLVVCIQLRQIFLIAIINRGGIRKPSQKSFENVRAQQGDVPR